MDSEEPTEVVPSTPLATLLEVQDLDTVISQLQHRRETIEERRQLAEIGAALGTLDHRRAAADVTRGDLATQQAALEAQIAATAGRHATIEQRLLTARGTAARDLQAMNEEIGHLAARRAALEDQELEIMIALEPVEAELAELDAERTRLAAEEGSLREAIAARETVIDAELAERVSAHATVAARLPEELRSRYDALRIRLGGTGAARLVGNHCDGCHLELPSMEVEKIRHLPPGAVVTCEQCGRILVPVPKGEPGGAAGGSASPPAAD